MLVHQPESELTTISTAELTFHDTQKLERQKYRALALLFGLFIISFTWLLFQSENSHNQASIALFTRTLSTLAPLLGAGWCMLAVYRGYHQISSIIDRRFCLGWLLIGLGLLINGLGNAASGYSEYVFHAAPSIPSLADIGHTLLYPLILVGLLFLAPRLKVERNRLRLALDAIITSLCLFGISWYLLIGNTPAQTRPISPLQTIMLISYIGWDIILLLAIVLVIYKRAEPFLRPSYWLYIFGVLSLTWADAGFTYLTNTGQYTPGKALIDSFWLLGALLLGFATIYQYAALARRAYTTRVLTPFNTQKTAGTLIPYWHIMHRLAFIRNFLIYIPMIALIVLTLYSQFSNNQSLTHLLDLLCSIVIPTCIARYLITTYENERLFAEKEQGLATAELLREATTSLSTVLEMDLLLNHIVSVGATALGFDAVALVVIEEYDRPLDEQSSLQARASTPGATEIMSWLVTGKMIPYCTALMGSEIKILWADAPPHPMTQVHQWHIDQRIQSSLFIPLAYQGKTQGSLAFSLRNARQFSLRECYIAHTFASEVANVIEHAHFYEMARENALFAQAMSNVAARLNSVVATGLGLGNDIHELICTEGANALSADLAILYVMNTYNQFIPLAAVTDELEPTTLPQEWPALTSDDYNTLIVQSPQPALLQVYQTTALKPQAISFDSKHSRNGGLPAQVVAHTYAPPSLQPAQTSRTTSNRKHRAPFIHSLNLQDALQRRFVLNAILAPLFIHQTPIGLLVLARTHREGTAPRRSFALADLTHALDFAGQASIAFTNARLYEQLSNAHRRMQELDQLKDQFMITASHELRTPLTAVQGYLELLEHYHDILPPPQQQEFVQKASRGCDELVLLLNNVMDASYLEVEAGIQSAHLERVAVRKAVESVMDLIVPQAKQEDRSVQITIPAHLTVKADPTRLRQVIRNLSVNALKYSSPGTPLLFSAQSAFIRGPSVIISITDRGKGIKPQDQGKLFQRFVRLESDLNSTVRGSGLGLYISRRLVEAMNGKIWLESSGTPGAGTTFYIQLPMD